MPCIKQFFRKRVKKSAWSMRPVPCWEPAKPAKVDDDEGDNDDIVIIMIILIIYSLAYFKLSSRL